MKLFKLLATLIFFLLHGCSDFGNDVVPEIVSGKFVVDAFSVACTLRTHPNNSNLKAFFPYTLKYHFEGLPGTVNQFQIWATNSDGVLMFLDYAYPDSVGKQYTWSSNFWTRDSLANTDSVEVNCRLRGAFWNPNNELQRFDGVFQWSTAAKIPVTR